MMPSGEKMGGGVYFDAAMPISSKQKIASIVLAGKEYGNW